MDFVSIPEFITRPSCNLQLANSSEHAASKGNTSGIEYMLEATELFKNLGEIVMKSRLVRL